MNMHLPIPAALYSRTQLQIMMLGKIKGDSVSKTNILRKALTSKLKYSALKVYVCVWVCLFVGVGGEGLGEVLQLFNYRNLPQTFSD
jgi:hypothetical protein